MLIYNDISGLLQGWYLPVVRFWIRSTKVTAFKFVSQVILRSKSSLKIFIKSFLILSARCLLVYPRESNPSSRYRPILFFLYLSIMRARGGLYILLTLGDKYGKHRIHLYCDDGLACFGYTSESEADRIRKVFIKIFKEDFDPSINCKTNSKAADFLDVTLNLTTG